MENLEEEVEFHDLDSKTLTSHLEDVTTYKISINITNTGKLTRNSKD